MTPHIRRLTILVLLQMKIKFLGSVKFHTKKPAIISGNVQGLLNYKLGAQPHNCDEKGWWYSYMFGPEKLEQMAHQKYALSRQAVQHSCLPVKNYISLSLGAWWHHKKILSAYVELKECKSNRITLLIWRNKVYWEILHRRCHDIRTQHQPNADVSDTALCNRDRDCQW